MASRQPDSGRVYALVAAAGRGERFGGDKLLAPWQGRTLLGHVLHTLDRARQAGLVSDILVIHRAGDEPVSSLAEAHRATLVTAQGEASELSDSLRSGFEVLGRREPGPAAALVCLGDQPMLRLEVLRALIAEWRDHHAAAIRPSYAEQPDQPGHPVLLDRTLWRYAGEIAGPRGLGPALEQGGIAIRTLVVKGMNPDVDTREDLRALDNPASLPS